MVYQINNILIPSLAKFRYHSNSISVRSESKLSYTIPKGNAVVTGLSCGVDSFETISNHININTDSYEITHATFLNVGSHGVGENAKKLYLQRLNLAENAALDLDINLVHINSNIGELFGTDYVNVHTFLSASAILTMQKLFNTYYYASGYPISEFKINESTDSANFDLLTLSSISTENLQFYTTGIEKTRLDKVKVVSNFEPSYSRLNVCTRTINNCGECDKCIRTQLELDSIDKLDLYHEVFDLNKYNKNRNSYIGYTLTKMGSSFDREIIDELRKTKGIPFASYFYFIQHLGIQAVRKTKNLTNKLGK